MNIQGFFTKQQCEIFGTDGLLKGTELIHLTRQGISNNDFAHTHKFKGLLQNVTIIDTGDLLKVDEQDYLVTAMRKIQFMNTNQANLLLCDEVCSLYRLEASYKGTVKCGIQEVCVAENIPCISKDTNGKMKTFDAGLLESTIKIVYLQESMNIKLTDRLVLGNKAYQVDSIDNTVKGIAVLQLSEDKRK